MGRRKENIQQGNLKGENGDEMQEKTGGGEKIEVK